MSRDVYETLRDDILQGRLAPAAPLVEAVLAQNYAVSRTPIREALLRLERDGLVDRQDRGMGVRSRTPEEVLEIYAVRIVLMGFAARLAAGTRSDFDLAVLNERYTRLADTAPDDATAMVESNLLFQQAFWASSHNRTLIELLHRLHTHLVGYPITLTHPGRWASVLSNYRNLIDAIADRDEDKASAIASEHMREARDIKLMLYTANSVAKPGAAGRF